MSETLALLIFTPDFTQDITIASYFLTISLYSTYSLVNIISACFFFLFLVCFVGFVGSETCVSTYLHLDTISIQVRV